MAAAALGLAASPAGPLAVAVTGLAAALVGVSASARVAAALLAVAACAGGAGAARVDQLDRAARGGLESGHFEALAAIASQPRPTATGWTAELDLQGGPRVLGRADTDMRLRDARPGMLLRVAGRLARPRSPPEAEFDWPAHLRRQGIAWELRLDRVWMAGASRGGWRGVLDGAVRRAHAAFERDLPPAGAALMRGMALGDDSAVDPLLRDDFRTAGLAHLLAASGQNVMLLCLLALPALAWTAIGPRGRAGALALLVILYVLLAGAEPSLQRAGVMGLAGIAGAAAGRPASRWYALLLACVATLAWNPLAVGDAGWQLSFAAVLGIALLSPPLTTLGAGEGASAPRRVLVRATAVTAAATLATAPLLAARFGSIPLAALPANLLALPAVAPVMWIGMLETTLAQLPVPDGAGALLGQAARPPLAWLATLAVSFSDHPLSSVELRLPAWGAAVSYAVLVLAIGLGRRRAAIRGTGAAVARAGLPRGRRAAIAAVAVIATALTVSVVLRSGGGEPPAGLEVAFLDVGQGDGTLIRDRAGAAILFDAGPPEARTARLLRRLGVRRLSLVVLTHASRDHHGGLREVAARLPIGTLADGGDGTRDDSFRAAVEVARDRGTQLVRARAGVSWRVGETTVRILSPAPRPPGPAPEDPNPRAVVAIVSWRGFDLLLSADAESPTLTALALPPVEALKVPHHGSADPGLPAILDRLDARVAVIEVGRNSYGHPDSSTLRALRRVPHVLRTDRHGTVRLTVAPDGAMTLRTERPVAPERIPTLRP